MTKHFFRLLLNMLPPLSFFRINRWLFSRLGYNIHSTARISSLAKLLGNINISVGRDTFIGHYTLIMGGESKIIIGDYCDISSNVTIISGTHEIDPFGIRMAGSGFGKDIVIGNGVWIGASVLILPGVEIANNAIVAAGSVVTRNVKSFTIVAGNPAKPIKTFNSYSSQWEIIEI